MRMSELINQPVVRLIGEITIKDIVKLYVAYQVVRGINIAIDQRLTEANEKKKTVEVVNS